MCNVIGSYFKVNGVPPSQLSCSASSSDTIAVGLRVTFDPVDVGTNFKATLRINTPSGELSATTNYQNVIGITTYELPLSAFGITPSNGTYSISQCTVYDSNGNVVCQGTGGTGQCETLTIGPVSGTRTIYWSGYEWTVKSALSIGPGPNNWSNRSNDVYVDTQGRLHLTITNRAGVWYCTEIISLHTFGYGTYTFNVSPTTTQLDPNAVFGMFTYLDDTHEIDIEFSQWSDFTDPDNAGFTIQPLIGGYTQFNHHRFYTSELEASQNSFTWTPDNVSFTTKTNIATTSWNTTSANTYIPTSSNEKVRLNLWLYQGSAPQNGLNQEIIIDSFQFTGSSYECKDNKCTASTCIPSNPNIQCYPDLASCQNVCKAPVVTYDCTNIGTADVPNYQCTQVQGTAGKYIDITTCTNACQLPQRCGTGTVSIFGNCMPAPILLGGLGITLLFVLLARR